MYLPLIVHNEHHLRLHKKNLEGRVRGKDLLRHLSLLPLSSNWYPVLIHI